MTSSRNSAAQGSAALDSNAAAALPVHPYSRPKRLSLKAEMARASRLAREAAGVTQRQLALDIGAQAAHVARAELAHERETISVLHVARGPRAWALSMIGWAAAEHGATVETLPAVESLPQHARDARVQLECGDVVRAVAEGAADGTHDRGDLIKREREIVEAIEALRNDLAWVRETLKEM